MSMHTSGFARLVRARTIASLGTVLAWAWRQRPAKDLLSDKAAKSLRSFLGRWKGSQASLLARAQINSRLPRRLLRCRLLHHTVAGGSLQQLRTLFGVEEELKLSLGLRLGLAKQPEATQQPIDVHAAPSLRRAGANDPFAET